MMYLWVGPAKLTRSAVHNSSVINGIPVATPLLVQASSFDDDLLYLIEGESVKYYIWKLAFNDVFGILKDASRHKSSSRIDLEY